MRTIGLANRPVSRSTGRGPRPVDGSARGVAYALLRAVDAQDGYANLLLPRMLGEAGISGRDAALATELGYGTLRACGTLDEVIAACSSRPLSEIEPAVLDLLRLGAYQLLRTRIPAHAAVAATVEMTRTTGNARSAGFVNAILRKVSARDWDGWIGVIGRHASPLGRLALQYSHPGWIVQAFEDAMSDPDEIKAALEADDARPQTHLVGWPGRITRRELREQADGTNGPYSPYAVRMTAGGDPATLPAVRAHRAAVQDEGSQLCALALTRLPTTPGVGPERWLDLCAGPGGKAALLAALADAHDAHLTANELHPHRAELVAQATRGWDVDIRVGDARQIPESTGGYDRILLDAPCTGLGALRRRPEARWRKSPADLAELVPLQAELIDAAARLVRPGGVVAYVTCSPHRQETTEQVEAALHRHPRLRQIPAAGVFDPVAPSDAEALSVQLWPHRHGTDAMFFAAFGAVRGAEQRSGP
jgi:16S rRNA (cytosine967-C5)-methyltransferase